MKVGWLEHSDHYSFQLCDEKPKIYLRVTEIRVFCSVVNLAISKLASYHLHTYAVLIGFQKLNFFPLYKMIVPYGK